MPKTFKNHHDESNADSPAHIDKQPQFGMESKFCEDKNLLNFVGNDTDWKGEGVLSTQLLFNRFKRPLYRNQLLCQNKDNVFSTVSEKQDGMNNLT